MMFTFIFFILLRYYILIGNNEVKSSAIEIIKHWGYEVEDINVTTNDGYILHIHRIPQGKNQKKKRINL